MSLENAVSKAKISYETYSTKEKREITKIITGSIRPERAILNLGKGDK